MERKALRITQGKNFDLLFKISRNLFFKEVDHPCKGMQDSLGSWIPLFRFRIPGTRFQSLLGFRID